MLSDNGNNIKDNSGTPGILGYDPTSQQLVLLEAVSVTTDTVNGKNVKYGVLQSNASFSASSLAINDPVTTANKATVDAGGNLHVAIGGPLAAGTNVIGHVIVDSAGNVSVTNLPSLPAGTNVIGHVIVDSGSVSVSNFPSCPAIQRVDAQSGDF